MKKIIFVDRDATVRSPMACEIMKDLINDGDIRIEARGLVVLFPEPINQKAEAVMVSNGIKMEEYSSRQLEKSDIDEDTVVLLIEKEDLERTISIIGEENLDRVFAINELSDEELPIMDPYGGVLGTYGICFETLTNTLRKVKDRHPEIYGGQEL